MGKEREVYRGVRNATSPQELAWGLSFRWQKENLTVCREELWVLKEGAGLIEG